jgi:hypothetical protein
MAEATCAMLETLCRYALELFRYIILVAEECL